jgi:tetratricopeptide (TPR) repeat protein
LSGDPIAAGDTIPRYLLSPVGKAFHRSPNSVPDGLKYYVEAAGTEKSGSQWLLGRLAIEQQEQGILPKEAIEPPYIRGMTLYREYRISEAESFLKRVISSDEIREEVAISCHLVGKIWSKKPGMKVKAEDLLRRSLALLEKLHDQHGQAQALHTLGQLIGKDRNRVSEAEELLRRSLEIGEKIKNKNHQAQVLFSLGKLIWEKNQSEALQMLERSIELNRKVPWARKMVQRELDKRLKK